MEEIWKDVTGYEGLYQVSNIGNVRSVKPINREHQRVLKPFDNGGYNRVCLIRKGKKVNVLSHRLVAMAFIPNPDGKTTVNHKDGNKKNNCVENLEWATNREQTRHAIKIGLRNPYVRLGGHAPGPTHPASKALLQLDENGNVIKRWGCSQDAADFYNTKRNSIWRCCRGERVTHRGFRWAYEKDFTGPVSQKT